MRQIALGKRAVVLGAGDVVGALDVAADEVTGSRLVEGTLASGEQPRMADEVVDDRGAIGPVHSRGRQETPVALGRRRQPALSRSGGRRADEDQRKDALREGEGEQLRERSARRDTDDVRGPDPVGVEYA